MEIFEIIRGYRMPISDLQEWERARTKIGYLWIEGRAGIRTLDVFADLINKWPLTKLFFAIEYDFLFFFPSFLFASEKKFKNTLHTFHPAILFSCSAKTNKSVFPPIKVKLYHKAIWDSISTSLSNQLAILHDPISNPINVDNLDLISISNNIAANISKIQSWTFTIISQRKHQTKL